MGLDLDRPAAPVILAHYPGMAQQEQDVWDRFLVSENNIFTGFLYNVRVGDVAQSPPGTEENLANMWREINQSRLDALGITDEELIVFEVKVSAGLSAIGQAIGGQILTRAETTDSRIVRAAIVSNGIRPDARTVALALNIDIFVV